MTDNITNADQAARLRWDMEDSQEKAIDNLARYKFQNFGYWAAIWVHLNRIQGMRKRNPFGFIVKAAKALAHANETAGAWPEELSLADKRKIASIIHQYGIPCLLRCLAAKDHQNGDLK